MDLDDLSGDARCGQGLRHDSSRVWPHRGGDGHSRQNTRPGSHPPSLARELWRAAVSRPRLVGAAAGLLVVLLTAALWGVILLLGYVEAHGLQGLIKAALAIGARLWEGR